MNRNSMSHFAQVPHANIQRSVFNQPHDTKTSFNFGDVVPFYVREVMPGDSVSIDTTKVIRLSTPLTPVMSDMYLDSYYFFVPYRILWTHFKEFMGENTESAWIPETEYQIPQIEAPASTGWNVGTIADYLGLPVGVAGIEVSALPFRAYAKIVDHWFRDENLSDPLYIDDGDTDVTGSNGSTYVTDVALGGMPFKAAKKHDYFTSALPGPMKHADIALPLGALAPVFAGDDNTSYDFPIKADGTHPPLHFQDISKSTSEAIGITDGKFKSFGVIKSSGDNYGYAAANGSESSPSQNFAIYPINLYADMAQSTAASINQLRMAFAIQHYYETNARMGSRYEEVIKAHFNVDNPDSRIQEPEYLGGNRIPIKVSQVLQNSAQSGNTANTPLGTTGAYSLTVDNHSDFTKSFTEFGVIIGVMCARYSHNYQQGIERFWSRKDLLDFYTPELANIGEQAILNKELFAQGTDDDNEVFGYQEAWADYRVHPDNITGMMRSVAIGSLDIWHLGDDYASLPTLSDAWIREDKSNVDRILSVTSAVSHQLFGDILVNAKFTRPMPVYSVPGLQTM